MTSPAGIGFLGVLVPFMLAYPGLLFGATENVPFTINATIVASVGGQNGYTGNVAYNQADAIFAVQVGGQVPKSALPPALGGTAPTGTSTVTNSATVTATTGAATTTEATAPTATTTHAAEPTTTAATPSSTQTSSAPVAKRQAPVSDAATPSSQDPAIVEAWLKAVINKLATDDGVAAPFPLI